MGHGERQPDRSAASEQVLRVGGGLVVAEGGQGHRRRQQRARPERQVERDHAPVRGAQRAASVHGSIQPHPLDGRRPSLRRRKGNPLWKRNIPP